MSKRRTRGTGSVEKYATKGGPRYRIQIGVPDRSGKVRLHRQFGFTTKRAAEDALASVRTDLLRGEHVHRSAQTVAEFVDDWLAWKQADDTVRESSIRNYEMVLRAYVIPHIGAKPLQSLSDTDLNRLWTRLATNGAKRGGPLSPTTVAYVRTVLVNVLTYAEAKRVLVRSPHRDAAKRRPRTAEKAIWSPEQMSAFITGTHATALGVAWRLFWATGARRGEVLALRWSDLSLPESGSGSLSIRRSLTRVSSDGQGVFTDPKTDSSRRTMTIDAATVRALRSWRTAQSAERLAAGGWEHDLVLTRPTGRPWSPERVSQIFVAEGARLGMPRIVLHGVRHSVAVALLDAGVPVKDVSERLGHSSALTTMRVYAHALPKNDQRSSEVLADALAI